WFPPRKWMQCDICWQKEYHSGRFRGNCVSVAERWEQLPRESESSIRAQLQRRPIHYCRRSAAPDVVDSCIPHVAYAASGHSECVNLHALRPGSEICWPQRDEDPSIILYLEHWGPRPVAPFRCPRPLYFHHWVDESLEDQSVAYR